METTNLKSDIRNKIFVGLGIILISAVLLLIIFAVVPSRINEDFVIDYVQRKAQTSIVVGKPVKWVALVDKDQIKENKLLVEIPKSATNISVRGIKNANDLLLARPESPSDEEKRLLAGISFALPGSGAQIQSKMASAVDYVAAGIGEGLSRTILEDSSKKAVNVVSALRQKDIPEQYVVVEYSTPAPKSVEKSINQGKEVTVSAAEDPKYTDILAYTKIPEIYTLEEQDKIKVESKTNPGEKVDFQAYDLNKNGKIDYVEWTVPHLSTQTYNVIYITKAFILDDKRNLKTDIFDSVKEKDSVWSQVINPGEYVRVVFAENLVDKNDISLWAKSASGNSAQIEIYIAGEDKLIAKFDSVSGEKMHRVLLTQLGTQKSDAFDLKVFGSPVLIDYIVDPDCSAYGNCSPGGYCDGEPGSCVCYTNYDIMYNCSQCSSGYGDCNSNPSYDGCETSTSSDPSNCGGCGSSCSASNVSSYTCTGGSCGISSCSGSYVDCNTTYSDGCEIDTSSDTSHCGGCNSACSASNATGYSCSGGSCSITSCSGGYGDCNTTYSDGCEIDTNTSTSHCGGCNSACSATQAASYSCSLGSCSVASCNPGYGDCNTTYSDGCEIDTSSDTSHCGGCNSACSATQAASYSCSSGSCSVASCNAGYGDCSGGYADGCETNTDSDTSNCGGCGSACSAANVSSYSCAAGSCSISVCSAGYADCNSTYGDGCEIDTNTDTSNCGGCGAPYVCSASNVSSYTCTGGSCGISVCSAGYADCNSGYGDGCEIDTNTDTSNCGGCTTVCSAANVSSYSCTSGVCGISSCSAGYADCDSNYANGCETNTNTDPSNCGGCGAGYVCSVDHATEACSGGSCSISSCDSGYTDCNTTYGDGCEVNTASDTSNCGGCGTVCSATQAASYNCSSGSCSVASCNSGYSDCNTTYADGCEINIYTDTSNCGGCGAGYVCSVANATEACSGGSCSIGSCDSGYADCNSTYGDGCEIDTTTNTSHCGGCNQACSASNVSVYSCTASSCGISSCSAGYADCDSTYGNGCEVNTNTDTSNCGGCGAGYVCSVDHATEACSGGSCSISSCDSGYGDCNTTYADGCETDTNSSTSYCGNCSTSCTPANATPGCTLGNCYISSCNAGYADCNNTYADGCEISTSSDVSNCGGCGAGYVCSVANATEACAGGVCSISSCDPTYVDCNNTYADGCEISTSADPLNCSGCGSVCSVANATENCSSGACGIASCDAGYGDCNSTYADGCEANTNTDISHCGNCVTSCVPSHNTPVCSSGVCAVGTCDAGYGDCNSNASDGCETLTAGSDLNNCGGCGTVCSYEHAAESCAAGVCSMGACDTNYYPEGACNTYCLAATTCNGHGSCTSSGSCTCDTQYYGSDCSILDESGPAVSISSITADSTSQLTILSATAVDTYSSLSATPYWFAETTGGEGATSSADWQTSTSFVDTGLSPNTQYTYKVKAKDFFNNASDYSATSSKYTLANVPSDLTATGVSTTQVYVSFSANSNPAGTQYYVENVTLNTNSGWITDTNWTSSSLTCATTYTFKVKAKNGDGVETSYTGAVTGSASECAIAERSVSGGGGGSASAPVILAPQAPSGGFSFFINSGSAYTENRNVALAFNAGSDVTLIDISSSPNFSNNVKEIAYKESYVYDLCQGAVNCPAGNYAVYVKFLNEAGGHSETLSRLITLGAQPVVQQIVEQITQVPQNVAQQVGLVPQQIGEIPQQIIGIFNPPQEPPLVASPIEAAVPRETPFAFTPQQVLPPKPLSDFILTPLPDPVQELAQKFPEFGEVLAQSGVEKGSDIGRLRVSVIKLPDLSSTLALESGTPVSQLNEAEKQKMPSEVVFAKTSNGLVDMNTKVTFDDAGNYKQNISIVAGEEVQLIFKTAEPADSVKGRIVFKSRSASNPISYAPDRSLLASLISLFAPGVEAQTFNDSNELYLEQFDYKDTGSGVYVADVQLPPIDGEYDIKTVVNYKNAQQKSKEFSMTAFVDPEGYVFENISGNEARIKGAEVTLYWLNPEIQQYEVWPAEKFLQTNPQITDRRGTYSFLVAPGYYYLEVKASGYGTIKEKVFQVTEGSAMHINIEMKPKYFWLKPIYWETGLLIALIALFLYHKVKRSFVGKLKPA